MDRGYLNFIRLHRFERTKTFFSTSLNAVMTQIWIAVCVYVLLTILAKEPAVSRNPSDILQILGVMLFEKVPIKQAFSQQPQENMRCDD